MKREVVISTRNKKKFNEIKRLFRGSGIKVISLDAFYGIPCIKEDGKTFTENAIKKALIPSMCIDKLILADDSGLEVDVLGGKPGVFSSRYASPNKDDVLNCHKLLQVLKRFKADKRDAQFRCIVAIAYKGKVIKTLEGICKGKIGFKIDGDTGFGYDPIFIPKGYKKTFARLGSHLKDKLSHRAKAVRKARQFIERYLLRHSQSL